MFYNYKEAVKNDLAEFISDNEYYYKDLSREDAESKIYDDAFVDDGVTGNGSGSYTFNRHEALLNLECNFNLLKAACDEFGDCIPDSEEDADVTIRCYLLGQVIDEVLDEFEAEGWFNSEEEGA